MHGMGVVGDGVWCGQWFVLWVMVGVVGMAWVMVGAVGVMRVMGAALSDGGWCGCAWHG